MMLLDFRKVVEFHFVVAVTAAGVLATSTRADAAAQIDFATDIQPILRAYCYGCHQGDKAAANLRLDSKDGALAGGLSGKVIIPGSSRSSPILKRLLADDPKTRMPLGGSPVPPEKIELIANWIDRGAPWPDERKSPTHWAYVAPVRPEIPKVRNHSWPRNPVDAFVLAKLESQRLTPSPEASRETLIRRVTLDLIGLPPAPEEIDRFVSDRSPDAYEQLVDRLLASPHYGERQARPWLDLARYADTNGYEADRRRSIWKYRDWVIQAFNRDLPYDRFTIEQIAGDMLPDAGVDERIATGFHRNTMFNEEGGVDKEEAYWETLVDRVNTTATVWLGTTLGCAQCHDHKYDPFTQKEYYQLLAFFNHGEYTSGSRIIEPRLELPTTGQETRKKQLESEIRDLNQRLNTSTPELAREQADWEKSVGASGGSWITLLSASIRTMQGTILTRREDGTLSASGSNPRKETYEIEAVTTVNQITGIRLEAVPDPSLPRGGPGRDPYGNFVVTDFQVEAASPADPSRFEHVVFEEIQADNGKVNDKNARQLWTIDASREDERRPRQIVFTAASPFGSGEVRLRIRIRQDSEYGSQGLGRFRLSVTSSTDPNAIVSISHRLRPLLEIAEKDRTEEQKKELATYYRTVAPSLAAARRRVEAARKELNDLGIAATLVLGERSTSDPPAANLRIRGAFLSKGDLVYAGTPAALPPLSQNEPPSRLALAHWLTSRENPLTGRVAVNRFWELFFGRGLVETSEDFGSQGARPSHPELLDWLAVEFMERGWSIKAIQRLMVTSATYRQSSVLTASLFNRDPYNRLLARGPRFRMEAEMLRDAVLAASGLLSPKIGGLSVFPPQPPGIWNMPYNDDQWVESKGEDRYRRGLYTFVRRTAPYPSFLNFDAVSREICTVRRVRTNTPLQALTTLNDAAFFEAAQALARRVLAEAGPNARSRVTLAFRLCVARRPKPAELDRTQGWLHDERRFFESRPDDAARIAGVADPDLAAWTMLANVLLNMDETLTKE
jgi:hypothetical protein